MENQELRGATLSDCRPEQPMDRCVNEVAVPTPDRGGNKIKFKITFWKDIPERRFIIDDTNFFPKYFMGLDGILYENYGTEEKPMWENVFDSDYEIEIINL